MNYSELPFGVDVSYWQQDNDWKRISKDHTTHGAPVQFAGIRATVSWGYVDPFGQRNLLGALENKIYAMPYWVVYPNEDIKKQVDHFFSTLKSWGIDYTKVVSVVDLELHVGIHTCSRQHYLTALFNSVAYMKQVSGVTPVIYSRASFVDNYVTMLGEGLERWTHKPPEWYNKYKWWLAHYLTSGAPHPGPVLLPKGVDRRNAYIHQNSEHGKILDGMSASKVDLNRWISPANIINYFDPIYGFYTQPEPPVEPPPVVVPPTPVIDPTSSIKKLQVASQNIAEVSDWLSGIRQ